VYVAPVGSTAPTNITGAWDAAWDALGLLSEDGMTESRDQDSTDLYAWGGILVRTIRSKHKRTFTVTALEDNPVVWQLVNPGSSANTTTGVTTRDVYVPTVDPRAFGFELVDGDITKRIVVPKGEVVEVGDVTYSDSEMNMKELTINVYPASDGLLYREITDDPQAEVA
jgi:hypothetical protein